MLLNLMNQCMLRMSDEVNDTKNWSITAIDEGGIWLKIFHYTSLIALTQVKFNFRASLLQSTSCIGT